MADDDRLLITALERLRMNHLAFRRAAPEEMREIEALRVEVLKLPFSNDKPDLWAVRMRLRLMERAFYVLQLTYFANAPENHGWMNLFRRWGRSPAFNKEYAEAKDTLSPLFRNFFEQYLQNYTKTIEEQPIHHPWLRPPDSRGAGIFMDSGRTEPPFAEHGTRSGVILVVDHKRKEGRDQTYETPSAEPSSGAPPSGEPPSGGGPSTPNE